MTARTTQKQYASVDEMVSDLSRPEFIAFWEIEKSIKAQRELLGECEPWFRLKARVLELVPFSMVCTGDRANFKVVYQPTQEQGELLDKIDAMIAHIRAAVPA